MKNTVKKIAATAALFAACLLNAPCKPAGTISFEFIDQQFGDILYALSSFSGISIIGDETVIGKTTFQFSGTSFDDAFDLFLRTNRLYAGKTDRCWTVTKIRTERTEGGMLRIDAFDSTLGSILERLSAETGTAIVFSALPQTAISLHAEAEDLFELVSLAVKPFAGYGAERFGNGISVGQTDRAHSQISGRIPFALRSGNGLYSCDIDGTRASDVFASLCAEEGVSWSNLVKNDSLVSGVHLENVDYETLLETVLVQSGCDTFLDDSIRYFTSAKTQDSSKRARSRSETWTRIETGRLSPAKAAALLSGRFPEAETVPLEDGRAILFKSDAAKTSEAQSFLALAEQSTVSEAIKLKYISSSELLKALPPSADKSCIAETGTGNSIFFTGPTEMKERFLSDLAEMDKPRERIRYDMLIIQYDNSRSSKWAAGAELKQTRIGDMTAVSGNFGNLLNLNFDVITLFGYRFSMNLDAALAENRAKVCTDTTLHAVSGETVKFRNTSTYRYRDTALDPETGKPVYTGVTREIVSGIVLEITGRISGDGLVTMTVHASVSKRGADVSSTAGNPPATSEKSIETRLSAKNGEPVILSGLTQNDESLAEGRVPFISRIPLLGLLFRHTDKKSESAEMVIYLVPHISNGPDSPGEKQERLATAFERLVRGKEDSE